MGAQRKSSLNLGNLMLLCLVLSVQLGLCEIPSRYDRSAETESLLKQLEQDGQIGEAHGVKGRDTGKKSKDIPAPTSINCDYQGLIAIPRECAKYFLCPRAEMESTVEYCPENHLFHHRKSKCLQITQDECKASMCKDTTDKFAHPYAKEKYLTCERMFPEVKFCKDGEIFDSIAEYCVPGSPTDNLKSSSEEDRSNEEGPNRKANRGKAYS